MRSKVYVKIIAAVLLCFQLLMLAACNGSGKDTEYTTTGSTVESTTDPGAQTTDGTSAGIDLVENGKAKYKVVRPDSASGACNNRNYHCCYHNNSDQSQEKIPQTVRR